MNLRNPVAAHRRISEMQENGADADELPTGDLASVFLGAVALFAVGAVASLGPPLLELPALLATATGAAFGLHLSIPLWPRVVAYLRTWRYPG